MRYTSCATLYRFAGDKGYERVFIPLCHWQESRAATISTTGLQTVDGVIIYLPIDSPYPKTKGKDIMLEGNIDFEFDNYDELTIANSLKELRTLHPDFVTVKSVDKKAYGSKHLQHYKVLAK